MKYFQIFGSAIGFFPEWRSHGWIIGTQEQASELLGLLLRGSGTQYAFALVDARGSHVTPVYPHSTPAPEGWGLAAL